MQVHEKRKHQDQISILNSNNQRNIDEYLQNVQEQQMGEQHLLDGVHYQHPQPVRYQPVQAQQGWIQQQGGRAHALYPQHNQKPAEINYSPKYKYVTVLDLDYLKLGNNIEYVLQNVKHFLGCFPFDRLPPFPTSLPKSMIINTHASNERGEHWVALVCTETQCYYFDSFGLPIQPNILTYLQPFYNSITRSDRQIQDITSNFCGAYSVSFVLHVKDDVSFNNFHTHYNSNYLLQNDDILKHDFNNINFHVEM